MQIRFFIVQIFLLILLSATVASGQTGWTIARQNSSKGDLNTVFFADSENGWIGGDNGYIARTSDAGRTWIQQSLNTKEAVNDIYFRSSDKGYVLAGDRIFSSVDGGQNWREEKILRADDFGRAKPELYSIRFTNKREGWIVGSVSDGDAVIESLVLHTNDGGALWRKVRVPTKEELIHVDFINEKRGWVVGANGTILSTSDAGETWRRQIPATTATLYHVDFKNENNGWIVGDRGLILATIDGGTTWRKIESNVQRTLLSVEFINEKTGWIVGRGGTILRSDDGGRTWIKQDSKTSESLFGLFISKKQGWAVGGKGLILRYER